MEEDKKTCSSCTDTTCAAKNRRENETDHEFADRLRLEARLCRIKNKIVVLSGKGGVGKSTVAVNLAASLAADGYAVGLLDVDIHGPSVPTMLGLQGRALKGEPGELLPVEMDGLKVMSVGLLLHNPDDAIIWRGPMKMGVIKQFITDVNWGDLDYLIIDAPPGTGDEPLSVCQLIKPLTGAVIVTTPQKIAAVDVRKSVSFCKRLDVPVLGIVENMSGFVCPNCGQLTQILPEGAGRKIAHDMDVPFLGAIPIDPGIAQAADAGSAFISNFALTQTGKNMEQIIGQIVVPDKNKKLNA